MTDVKNKRLYPPSYGNLYYSMTVLREAIQRAVGDAASQISNNKRVLFDAGCGTKPYKEIAVGAGLEYYGADVEANREAEIKIGPDGAFQVADSFADIVLSSQVLEHVYDFENYLRECNRVTKAGGILILSTPGHWCYHPDPADYWRWTSEGLRKVVERNDWTVEKFEGLMSLSAIALQYLQDNTRNSFRFKLLITIYTWMFQKMIAVVDMLSNRQKRNEDASVFLVVARKRLRSG